MLQLYFHQWAVREKEVNKVFEFPGVGKLKYFFLLKMWLDPLCWDNIFDFVHLVARMFVAALIGFELSFSIRGSLISLVQRFRLHLSYRLADCVRVDMYTVCLKTNANFLFALFESASLSICILRGLKNSVSEKLYSRISRKTKLRNQFGKIILLVEGYRPNKF